jgi:hypothetical protein
VADRREEAFVWCLGLSCQRLQGGSVAVWLAWVGRVGRVPLTCIIFTTAPVGRRGLHRVEVKAGPLQLIVSCCVWV